MFLVEFVRTGVRFSPPPPIRDIMKIKLITTILLLSLLFPNIKKTVEIRYNNIDELIQLSHLNIELDHHRTSELIHAYANESEINLLTSLGYEVYEIPNHAHLYYKELKEETRDSDDPMRSYHDYNELTAFMSDIAASYPSITNLFSIGQSVQGRELWVMEISSNPGVNEVEPEFKYIANMHGDETPGREFSLYLIEWLCENYGELDRATDLVDNTAIFIMPSMNPDGFESGSRYNANGVDLNRDFPDQFEDPNNTVNGRQPETRAVMEWSFEHNFVLSANMHSGALVANYPYDGPTSGSYSACPDDDVFVSLALDYSTNHPFMFNSSQFDDGITNGSEWYAIDGGMQDWNYVWEEDFDITLEQNDVKWPNESLLPGLWEDHKESMISYIEKVHTGLRGIITDSNNNPIPAEIIIDGINHVITNDDQNGDYYRLLTPGNYTVSFTSLGYETYTTTINIANQTPTVLDVQLNVNSNLASGTLEDFESGGFNTIPWEVSGDSYWIIDDDQAAEGMYSAKSGVIGSNQFTQLSVSMEINEPGSISFYKKISCESTGSISGNYYDYLSFYIDGIEQDKWAGEIDWSSTSFDVSSGEHTFTWKYSKDGGVVEGQDAVWIDFIVFPNTTSNLAGDANFDGQVNILDVVIVINAILYQELYEEILSVSDLNSDGELNVVDIVLLVNLILENG